MLCVFQKETQAGIPIIVVETFENSVRGNLVRRRYPIATYNLDPVVRNNLSIGEAVEVKVRMEEFFAFEAIEIKRQQ